ncbi:MAG: hypothetical protein KGJ86_00090 [Chloroflexota bacterium]|nr:hypothetical protein [Chloroflexota bacterium]
MPTATLERPPEAETPTSEPYTGPTVGQLVQRNAVIFRVTTAQFGQAKKLDRSQYQVDADRDYVKAQKLLLACDETKAIGGLFSEVRTYLESVSCPSNFKRGDYLLPIELLLEVDQRMAEFQARLKVLLGRLVDNYRAILDDERRRLLSLFNPADYPVAQEVAGRYFIRWQYLALATPTGLPEAIAAREQAKLAEAWEEAGEGVQQLLRAELAALVGHLEERLTGTTDGKPKIFRDSAVENITEFLAKFNPRNVTNDAEAALLAQRVRELLAGIEPQALRTDAALRERVRSGFSAVTAQLDELMVNRPKRRLFSLEEGG